jgi:hypothetical protein
MPVCLLDNLPFRQLVLTFLFPIDKRFKRFMQSPGLEKDMADLNTPTSQHTISDFLFLSPCYARCQRSIWIRSSGTRRRASLRRPCPPQPAAGCGASPASRDWRCRAATNAPRSCGAWLHCLLHHPMLLTHILSSSDSPTLGRIYQWKCSRRFQDISYGCNIMFPWQALIILLHWCKPEQTFSTKANFTTFLRVVASHWLKV